MNYSPLNTQLVEDSAQGPCLHTRALVDADSLDIKVKYAESHGESFKLLADEPIDSIKLDLSHYVRLVLPRRYSAEHTNSLRLTTVNKIVIMHWRVSLDEIAFQSSSVLDVALLLLALGQI